MKLDAALSLAEDRLRAYLREERARLVDEIETMRRQHATEGLLRSGATLKRIRDLGIESLSRRVEQAFSVVRGAVESVQPRLTDAKALMPVIVQFIPEDLDDQAQHIRKAVADLGVPNALPQLLDALAAARTNELQKAQAELQLFLGRASHADASAKHENVFGWLEVTSLLVTIALAVLWVRNPSGSYEPYLALVAAVATAGNLFKKWLRLSDRADR
jgi:hypothetical protein